MARIRASIEHNSGIPLGGSGTGSVEIRPDGYFHEWQIFNVGRWAPRQPEGCPTEGPDMPPGALAFYIRAAAPGRDPIVRRLGMRTDQNDLYSLSWCKPVEAIEFTGTFPVARLRYVDEDLPVGVTATMFSPFVPHDSRTSGTPGFHVVFELRNEGKRPVDVSLLGVLANPLAWGLEDRGLSNFIAHADGATFLTMRTAAQPSCKAAVGSLCLSVAGGTNSFVAGEFPEYCGRGWRLAWTGLGHVRESLLRTFRLTGRLPDARAGQSPNDLLRQTDEQIDAMPEAERRELVQRLREYALFGDIWLRLGEADAALQASPAGEAAFLKAARRNIEAYAGADRKRQSWGDGALCSSVRLKGGQAKEVRFALGWHFPHHYSATGAELGHMYEHWFPDAEAVCRHLAANADAHRQAVCSFARTLHDTTLPPEHADAWSAQLSTLVKCTWWTKSGDFAVWEGLGCCGFHTTDISYQGSFNILALYPDLQKRQMEMGARFQREDGRVHHFFTPDFSAVDNGFDRVDMNQQFVLLACRDWLWTGDADYLRRLWPHIVKAMDNTAQLDADGDGLPDHDTRRNTYDVWDFRGTPSYIASLWLSALLAAARMAEDLGESRRAAAWRQMVQKASAAFERKLWNGRYFSLWVDGDQRDECCMSDQIDGEWFTQLVGLGHCLPAGRIRAALRAVFRHNYRPEDGLINASYPPGAKPLLCTYRNLQAEAPWTGIEYAMASMMLEFGLVDEAAAVIGNIHRRYMRAGRFWNHVECGDHYYRAMSSWAVLLSATGFKMDAPRRMLTIAPPAAAAGGPKARRAGAFRAPWVSSTGWGLFRQTARRFELSCRAGEMAFQTLRVSVGTKGCSVWRNGARLAAAVGRDGGLTAIRLEEPVALKAGDVMVVKA